jgi:hypothetical protein
MFIWGEMISIERNLGSWNTYLVVEGGKVCNEDAFDDVLILPVDGHRSGEDLVPLVRMSR